MRAVRAFAGLPGRRLVSTTPPRLTRFNWHRPRGQLKRKGTTPAPVAEIPNVVNMNAAAQHSNDQSTHYDLETGADYLIGEWEWDVCFKTQLWCDVLVPPHIPFHALGYGGRACCLVCARQASWCAIVCGFAFACMRVGWRTFVHTLMSGK